MSSGASGRSVRPGCCGRSGSPAAKCACCARLGLDSGYLSRQLRSLEAAGLVKVAASPGDQRVRVARVTAAGRRECAALDKRSDELAQSLLTPLSSTQRERLVAELNRRSERGFDPSVGATALPHEVRPPAGEFFVAYLHGEAVGCGAVKHHADAPAEIKRMWIAPTARGLGLGRRLLERLEACARAGGARLAHIETSAVLVEALSLYLSTGWAEVPAFNDEPFADHWFEKALT
jgi:GNAT superfamily N-acetyltransferase